MARQLTFDLTTPPALSRSDFLQSPGNRDAVSMLDDMPRWPQRRLLLLGGPGSGKSHLSKFWAAEQGAVIVRARDLIPDIVDELIWDEGALIVADAHEITGHSAAEIALFHIWNLSAARGAYLLITARTPPRDWDLMLPDLRSRMEMMSQAVLGPPDKALVPAVLVKLFSDRQIQIAPEVVEWLALRMDRDLGLARRLVDEIDRASLADRRAITRKLAAELLDKLTASDA